MVTIEDRITLLLAIKEKGKSVTFDHIFEKIQRDVEFIEKRKVNKDEIENALNNLLKKGLIQKVNEEYTPNYGIDEYVEKLIKDFSDQLNRSYRLVWLAKMYYPRVAKLILPFLKDRAVSAVKVFSGKNDPIHGLDTIFVRYIKYKPKPVFLTIDSEEKLMQYVFDHCVDFIPYIHKLNSNEPDVFVVDIDAGEEILKSEKAFDFIKRITYELAELLLELDIYPMIKFSGSRGFQIWARFDNSSLRVKSDVFKAYREMAIILQQKLENKLQNRINELKSIFPDLIKKDRAITTSTVAHKIERAHQILIDWSVLKPMGDVRAPYSIHYKTGLVSLPLKLEQIEKFFIEDAHPMKVWERLESYKGAEFIPLSNPKKLIE
ncbi:MAG: hypothetical protein QW372_01605 [Nitrososphaerales archaeon]